MKKILFLKILFFGLFSGCGFYNYYPCYPYKCIYEKPPAGTQKRIDYIEEQRNQQQSQSQSQSQYQEIDISIGIEEENNVVIERERRNERERRGEGVTWTSEKRNRGRR